MSTDIPLEKVFVNYIRTEEDEQKDRLEAEWKQRRNQEAMTEFMRRNPDGRVIPKE